MTSCCPPFCATSINSDMKENVSLFDLFPDLDPGAGAEELLKQNTVEDVGLRPKEREVYVCLRSRVYLPLQLLSRTEGEICRRYDLRRAEIRPSYDPALLPGIDFSDLTDLLAGFFPVAPALLAGCSWEADGQLLRLKLKGNGLKELKPHLVHVEDYLRQCFGVPVTVEAEAGKELSAEELFAAADRLKARAREENPLPAAASKTPGKEGQSAAGAPKTCW